MWGLILIICPRLNNDINKRNKILKKLNSYKEILGILFKWGKIKILLLLASKLHKCL